MSNLIELIKKKKASEDEVLDMIFGLMVVKSYTRPNEAVSYIEQHVIEQRYVKADMISRQRLQHLYFVRASY